VSQECQTKVIGNWPRPRQSPAEGATGMDLAPGLLLGEGKGQGSPSVPVEVTGARAGRRMVLRDVLE
jgi:hypothetical protein